MIDEEAAERAGQHDHVQHVEANQRRLIDRASTEQQLAHRRPDERNRRGDVGADRHRPVRELIPRQQVAGERQQQRQEQHGDADHPVLLALLALPDAVLVGAGQEHPHQVKEDRRDHEVRGEPVHRSNPRAERDDVLDVLDRGVGALDRRHVQKEQRSARQHEHEQQRGRRGAEPERVAPGHRRLVGLRGKPVQQEVRDDGIARLPIGGRTHAPERTRVDAWSARGRFRDWCGRRHPDLLNRQAEVVADFTSPDRRRAGRRRWRATGGTRRAAWAPAPTRSRRRPCTSSRGTDTGTGA